jgi:hypothetical protein
VTAAGGLDSQIRSSCMNRAPRAITAARILHVCHECRSWRAGTCPPEPDQ